MTPQEFQEEIAILDKACRYIGQELTGGGLAALDLHAQAATAMLRKYQRLQASQIAQQLTVVPQPDEAA
jgi:hypothetical protein